MCEHCKSMAYLQALMLSRPTLMTALTSCYGYSWTTTATTTTTMANASDDDKNVRASLEKCVKRGDLSCISKQQGILVCSLLFESISDLCFAFVGQTMLKFSLKGKTFDRRELSHFSPFST
ncbi:uncharacterized protein LOC124459787 [Drosophila willistoni]|uniref:uncharacterized protein LOC124459787 n=1 Tax=Drosophila willistoni TaxID=7260 RepID=UPI001F071AC5|nr:uncharacterized protein LOC124459787 [Drosophila willistoni]